jgi:PTH1 family peptidyl-tRNA hydrolase
MFAWLRKMRKAVPDEQPARIICGLGNPGPSYANTRHNAGYLVVERIAARCGGKWSKYKNLAKLSPVEIDGQQVLLVQPLTYMNLSGRAVAPLLRRWSLPLTDLLVVHDDLDLPPGSIRLRPGGSSGGHKGIQSIIDHLQSRDFARLRIGIGRPVDGAETVDYVLQAFPWEIRESLDAVWEQAADAACCWVSDGIDIAMNRFNRRSSADIEQ